MSLSPGVLIRGLVSRILPPAFNDDNSQDRPARIGRYGEPYALSLVRKSHLLADEGSYFVTNNNGQTGIISGGGSAFSATAPCLSIYNGDLATNPSYKRIYLDFLSLVTTVVGSAASGLVNLQAALVIDRTNRAISGGTNLTANIVSPNMDSAAKSIATINFGALTAGAATPAARVIDPLHIIRAAVSGTVLDVVGEQKIFNFGGVEGVMNGSITVANANNIPIQMPPVILGPDQVALLYLWQNNGGTNVSATYAPNLGHWER